LYANGASGWFDAYFPDAIYSGGSVYSSSGWSVVAQNVGSETLQAGDLVSFVGMDGRMSVEKANGANGGAIVGVVTAAYIMDAPAAIEAVVPDAVPEGLPSVEAPMLEEPGAVPFPDEGPPALPEGIEPPPALDATEAPADVPKLGIDMAPEVEMPPEVDMMPNGFEEDSGYIADASVAPGGFMIVMIQGFAQVNVDASVEAGQWLVAGADGGAAAISERQLAWAERRGDVVIGRALQAAVDGKVWVYVNFR
jgi:hypothetical protein